MGLKLMPVHRSTAAPKSMILSLPSLVTKMFSGLMSRWIVPRAWDQGDCSVQLYSCGMSLVSWLQGWLAILWTCVQRVRQEPCMA